MDRRMEEGMVKMQLYFYEVSQKRGRGGLRKIKR